MYNTSDLELKFLGRGSAFNVKEGNTSAYIKEDGELLLIDCGSNIFEKIISKNLLKGVSRVYVAITHRHPDHIGSLGDLIFFCYYVLNIKVSIFETEEKRKIIKYLRMNGIGDELYNFFNIPIFNRTVDLNAVQTSHCHMQKEDGMHMNGVDHIEKDRFVEFDDYSKFKCYGYKIFRGVIGYYYSGDCNQIDFHTLNYFDKYYVDTSIYNEFGSAHYNIEELKNDCKKYNIDKNKIYCMHINHDDVITRAKEIGFNVVEVEK